MKKGRKIVATVTIFVQGNPFPQKNPQPMRSQACPAGNAGDMASGSSPRRRVSGKVWLSSVCITLIALAFPAYCWLDSLGSLGSKREGKAFVRRAITSPPVALATAKAPPRTSDNEAIKGPKNRVDLGQPEGQKASGKQTKTTRDPIHTKPSRRQELTLFKQALALQKAGRLKEAKTAYEASLKRSPHLASALNNLGVIYLQEKNYSESRKVLEKAISKNAAYADPYYNLACLYALQTNVEQSLQYLKQAIAKDATVLQRAMEDQDLGNLRGHVEYEEILDSAKKL